MKFDDVCAAIAVERDYQRERWGFRQLDGSFVEATHSVEEFIVYMDSYLSEAKHQISREPGNQSALDTLRKVVCLGIACFEQHGVPQREMVDVINGRDGQPTAPFVVEPPYEEYDVMEDVPLSPFVEPPHITEDWAIQ